MKLARRPKPATRDTFANGISDRILDKFPEVGFRNVKHQGEGQFILRTDVLEEVDDPEQIKILLKEVAEFAKEEAPKYGWFLLDAPTFNATIDLTFTANYDEEAKNLKSPIVHFAPSSARSTIEKGGLKPRKSRTGLSYHPRVYVAASKDGAAEVYSNLSLEINEMDVWVIDPSKLRRNTKFYIDSEFRTKGDPFAFYTYSHIPAEAVSLAGTLGRYGRRDLYEMLKEFESKAAMTHKEAIRRLVQAAHILVKDALGKTDIEKINAHGGAWGVLSAYRGNLSKSENKKRHGDLMRDIQKLRLKVDPELKSKWGDSAEKSIVLRDVSFNTLKDLSDKYNQEAFFWRDNSGTVGIYYQTGDVDLSFDKETLEPKLDLSTGKDLYSRGRSLSFGADPVRLPIKWDNHPITQKDLEKLREEGAI